MSLTTPQQIFDVSAPLLLAQNAKSLATDGVGCEYFSNTGLGCAVGLLFKDREDIKQQVFATASNTVSTHKLVTSCSLVAELFGGVENYEQNLRRFVYDLQRIHDRNNPQIWRELLTQLAMTYNLNPAVIQQ